MKKTIAILCSAALLCLSLTSCETPGQSAVAGAATGAAIGGLLHGRGSDAMAGAAIGAGAGYLLGHIARNERERAYEEGYYDRHGEYPDRGLPVARPTNRPGFVTSPYRPYNLIDVRGIPRGARVVDPSTDRMFINP